MKQEETEGTKYIQVRTKEGQMKGWKKRALSMLLAFLMVIGVCVPHSSIVHAEDPVPPAEGGGTAPRGHR